MNSVTKPTPPSPSAADDFLSSLPTLDALVQGTVSLDSGRETRGVSVRSSSSEPEATGLAKPESNVESSDAESSKASESSNASVSESLVASANEPAAEFETHRAGEDTETSDAPRRRVVLPIALFLATCASTFWVGVTHFQPVPLLPALTPWLGGDGIWARRLILEHWTTGLTYMACVMAILLVHELGHFFATLIYRVRASFPVFLPFPFNPIGTFGAVIGMHGGKADRKQLFDIGIAGPLAGLVIAIPVMVIGVMTIDVTTPPRGDLQMNCPLGVLAMIHWLRPDIDLNDGYLWLGHANGWFVAGWVGFLITGLNMMPISQLDGGHVIYALIGRKAHWVARGVVVLGIAFMVYFWAPTLILMTVLLLIVGTDHPPTSNDRARLGAFRTVLGWTSLVIPILCFPPFIFRVVG